MKGHISPRLRERLNAPPASFDRVRELDEELARARAEAERLRLLLNTPELEDFAKAVPLEAAHQRERWGPGHDEGKQPEDWFWVVGYLAGKALRAHMDGNTEKAKHHTITCAALLANWHARIVRDGTGAVDPAFDKASNSEPSSWSSPNPAPAVPVALPLLKEALSDAIDKCEQATLESYSSGNPRYKNAARSRVESLFRDLERDKERLEKQLQKYEG